MKFDVGILGSEPLPVIVEQVRLAGSLGHDPARIAATLAALAEGRGVVGVGTGGSAAQTMGLTIKATARTATLEHMATSIRRLVGGESIRFESGTEGRLAWLDLDRPRTIPIYAAGSGPRVLRAPGRR